MKKLLLIALIGLGAAAQGQNPTTLTGTGLCKLAEKGGKIKISYDVSSSILIDPTTKKYIGAAKIKATLLGIPHEMELAPQRYGSDVSLTLLFNNKSDAVQAATILKNIEFGDEETLGDGSVIDENALAEGMPEYDACAVKALAAARKNLNEQADAAGVALVAPVSVYTEYTDFSENKVIMATIRYEIK